VILDQLIYDCKRFDRKAQEQLYRLLAPKLFAVCLKYARNHEDAQDNLQEGFLVIFNKIEQYNFKGSFEGWAKRIMINHSLQKYRGISFLEIVNEDILAETEVETDDSEQISTDFLLKLIHELPNRYRLVFSLYVLDGYSHKEIATMLEITEGTSKSNLARARMILKEKIENTTGIDRNKKINP
jgi:RNA polymerase sigma-70 factor (ECF subfamily)